MESLKFVGGSKKLMKELQKTMFFAAYESVVFSSARSMTEKDQRKMLRESIVGTGASDIMTLSEQMVLGLNQFYHLYGDVPVVVNDDRNASTLSAAAGTTVVGSSRNDYDKVLKGCFFPAEKFWRQAHWLCQQVRWHNHIHVGCQEFE